MAPGRTVKRKLSRREFVGLSVAAGLGSSQPIVDTDVEVKTSDGTCDAAFFHPAHGSHSGVLVWHDSGGVRPSFREIGRRLAGEGYAVLVPNLFYRMARTPVFPTPFDPRRTLPTWSCTAAWWNRSSRRGYCLGGPYVLKTAAAFPGRVGAGVSFHGGFLITDKPDSPHLLAPKIKARLYFAISSDDDECEPPGGGQAQGGPRGGEGAGRDRGLPERAARVHRARQPVSREHGGRGLRRGEALDALQTRVVIRAHSTSSPGPLLP
jgi:Dienelactone hydrolase family